MAGGSHFILWRDLMNLCKIMDMHVLFESFSVTEFLNMAVFRNFEVMLRKMLKYLVYHSVILYSIMYL
jgi:hypothetical protein